MVVACVALTVGLAPAPTTAVDPSPPAASDRPRLDRAGTDSPDPVPEAVFANPNFQEEVVFSGLTQPIVVDFASDGRVFVGEKSGIIKVFDSVSDPTASIWADLRRNVHDYWDRGLLGLAVDPDFASNGRLYVAYTHNAPIGGTAPYWPDDCLSPPGGGGSGDDGCVASGRVSAITAGGTEQVLVEDWCQQFASHSMSDVVFDLEGALIVNGGDGANFNTSDYGQLGGQNGDPAGAPGPVPENPCGDPPAGVGGNMELPTAQGGALRAQDVRTTSDPTGLSGSVIRIDKMTGAAMPDNPAIGSADPNTRRIIAHGLRNPFRMAVHPVSNELWIGDVGWGTWEEINRHSDPDGAVRNFGWPCREGTSLEPGLYPQANLCTSLASWTSPVLQYCHNQAEPGCADHEVVNGDGCGGGGAISGLAFYAGGGYPDTYDNALFFADYTRDCIWVMRAGAGGIPDPTTTAHFATASVPVHLTTGPGGDLFYVDIGGSIRRIRYLGANAAPSAVAEADPASGSVPLAIDFDASNSSDPDGDPLTYAWDFDEDGDGLFNDATGATPSNTYESPGTYVARVRVSDGHGGTDIDTLRIDAGNTAPTATITRPSASLRWSVDEKITFAGTATDPDEGTLPPSAMTWNLIMVHCATTCHEHPIATFSGVSGGTFDGPDHEYPSHLLLRLTVEDSDGGSDVTEVELQPKTVILSLQSDPPGLDVTAGWRTGDAPFSMMVISGSAIDLNAQGTQVVDGFTYTWASWSDGQARTHTVHPTADATYRATFSGGFDDVPPGAPFGPDIAWLVDNGITAGCSSVPALYCPTSPVTRWQMALFLDRALDLPPTATDFFVDDEANPYEASINRLAAAGITNGCGPGRFCPSAIVLREQMASFLARALDLAATGSDFFVDDAGSVHEGDINRLAEAGITNGCAPGRFCPTSPVARNVMAAFLHRAIEAPLP